MTHPKILIVDDSTLDRMLLTKAVSQERENANLSEAMSATEALKKLGEDEFDAVFLDINMPGENGFSVLRNLRQQKKSSWPLVFVMSSSSHPDDVEEAYSSNATAFIAKPSSLSELRSVTNACLRLLQDTTAVHCSTGGPH